MRVIPKPGILNKLQEDKKMSEQEFADFLGASRSSLWRAKLPVDDNRFSLGQDVMAKILKNFPDKSFEDIFFLEKLSQVCYGGSADDAG
ncbi:hypothetical protein [Paenibacillus sp. IHBB 3054]|uniref:hypothetical protein n=1 Tax=Paenibacillus sp. IHBB 3054 TaxID=3425689 RepID=UPI003F68051D